jgi:FixJ family two-component response regulator
MHNRRNNRLNLLENLRQGRGKKMKHGAHERVRKLVCIVDDDLSVRRDLLRLFESAGYAAKTFASVEDYLAREIFKGLTCLVLAVRMAGLTGLDLQKKVASRGGCEQIVFITRHNDVPTCVHAMKNGAVDFLMKPIDSDEIVKAVKRAFARGKEHLLQRGERREACDLIDTLTPRELEVLRFVIKGSSNRQSATEMHISLKTIKIHRGRVMHKLGAGSVPDLVRIAQRARIPKAA